MDGWSDHSADAGEPKDFTSMYDPAKVSRCMKPRLKIEDWCEAAHEHFRNTGFQCRQPA